MKASASGVAWSAARMRSASFSRSTSSSTTTNLPSAIAATAASTSDRVVIDILAPPPESKRTYRGLGHAEGGGVVSQLSLFRRAAEVRCGSHNQGARLLGEGPLPVAGRPATMRPGGEPMDLASFTEAL